MNRLSRWLPWVIGAAILGWLVFFYAPELAGRVQPRVPFGFVRIENGWLYALGGLLVIVGLILVYSLAITAYNNRRRGSRKSPWAAVWSGHDPSALVDLPAFCLLPGGADRGGLL